MRGCSTVTGKNGYVTQPVPLLYNPDAGSADTIVECLRDDSRVRLKAVSPDKMAMLVRQNVQQKAKRVLVSGGMGPLLLLLQPSPAVPQGWL